jgi:NADP-dependent 3-hydroxy acid dehydrogenase YdfG
MLNRNFYEKISGMIKDKVAIVTGASSGIGYATALALSKAGAKVAIGARRTDKLSELENEITKNGGEAFSQKLDVTKKSDCDSFFKSVMDKWGQVDVLINNAGLMPLSFVKNLKVDEWDQMIDVNIKGVLYCTAAVIAHMHEKKSGHIINLSSVAGRVVFPSGSVYCATKHAVTAFSEGLREEFSTRSNIRVTCIEPGVVSTELTNTITDESLKSFVENSKKMDSLKPEDIASAILYAIDAPSHVNVNEVLIRPTTQER